MAVDVGQGLARRGDVAARERRPRALNRAVRRRDRRVETVRDSGGRPAEHFGEQQCGALACRQMLQRRDKRERVL